MLLSSRIYALTRFVLACAATALFAGAAFAQGAFPGRPITLIVPSAAGSSLDNIARLYGERLGQLLGQPIVIDIRTGGSERAVGARALAAARLHADVSGQFDHGALSV